MHIQQDRPFFSRLSGAITMRRDMLMAMRLFERRNMAIPTHIGMAMAPGTRPATR